MQSLFIPSTILEENSSLQYIYIFLQKYTETEIFLSKDYAYEKYYFCFQNNNFPNLKALILPLRTKATKKKKNSITNTFGDTINEKVKI